MRYFKEEENHIVCQLCRHYCKLKDGQVGICGVNKNINNQLVNLVYAHPIAINVDPIEKKPLYHFLPGSTALSFGTIGCNFKCPFCQNWDISQEKNVNEDITVTPEQMVELAIKNNAKSIAYTYSEPTIFYPYAKDVGLIAKEHGIKNIFVSNGFESPAIIEDMKSWVDAANIDLKSWDKDYYKKVLKGGLDEVKDTLRLMVRVGIWIEVTTLLIEGKNDSDIDLNEMAEFIANDLGFDVPWHLSAFHPDYKMLDTKRTSIDTLNRAKEIGKKHGLKYVYLGNVASDGNTYCPKCEERLIDRSGYSASENKIIDSKCPKCGEVIKGVWK
jgi:pyruvate formate lyase activating enzyme